MPVSDYVNLVTGFSKAWFELKDQRSILGFLWSFLNPLLMSSVLYLVFSQRMEGVGGDYFLFILSGTVIWNFFISSTQGATNSLVYRAEMVRNMAFPKEIIVLATIGTFIIQFFFEVLVLLILVYALNGSISHYVLIFPIIFILELLLVLAVSLFLSSICVFARDLDHVWNLLTRIGFFLAPIFYSLDDISGWMRVVVEHNPISQIIVMGRQTLLEESLPEVRAYILLLCFSLVLLF